MAVLPMLSVLFPANPCRMCLLESSVCSAWESKSILRLMAGYVTVPTLKEGIKVVFFPSSILAEQKINCTSISSLSLKSSGTTKSICLYTLWATVYHFSPVHYTYTLCVYLLICFLLCTTHSHIPHHSMASEKFYCSMSNLLIQYIRLD